MKYVWTWFNFFAIFTWTPLISIETVIGYCEDLHTEARNIFQKSENKEVIKRSDGVVMLRDSGKNSGNFSNARKAADKYRKIISLLEQAVLKDQDDQE